MHYRTNRLHITAALVLVLAITLGSVHASATTLFSDGFESGWGNWSVSGVSLKALNSYWGYWSLELDNSDYAIRSQSTVGYSNIRVQFQQQIQGYDWFPLDYFHLEYSPNGGANWYNVNSWTSNFGWSSRSYTLPSSCNDNANVQIKLRSQTNSGSDDCWIDEFTILGDPVQRTLTVNVSGSGSVGQNPSPPYYNGDVVTLTANPGTGYTFDHWEGALTGSTNPTNITMNADKTVTAVFAAIPYTLTVTPDSNGSVAKSPDQATYTYGQQVTLTATGNAGWELSSWTGDATGSTNPKVITIGGNTSIGATFSQIVYTISATSGGNGTVAVDPPSGPYYYGDSVTFTATPDTGYAFAWWSGSLSGNDNPKTVSVTSNMSVTGNFSNTQYTLTLTDSGNGTATADPSGPYYSGQPVTITATPDAGSQFDNWSGGASGSTNPLSITMDANKSIKANYSAIQYTLTTHVTGSGSIAANPSGPYYWGDTTTLTATPSTGYEFAGWSGTASGDVNPTTITFYGNHDVTATFNQVETPPQTGYRVLLVGDSWTAYMWSYKNLRDIFTTAGFSGVWEKGDVTAIGGTTASWWAASANLAQIDSELSSNPTIDMVHLSMGGNDMLAGQAGGGWYKGMGSTAENTLYDTIESNMETVIQHILNTDPNIHICICSYDYLNLWDTLDVPANQLMWNNLGQPTPRELNEAFIALGERQRDLAQKYGAAVTYINNWGQMHLYEGYNSVFGPGTYGAPWGHPSYPWEKSSVGGNNGDDPIHLNDHGYDIIALNCWNTFYKYFIDPSAGPLPTNVDDYYPAMPPADYSTIFTDGFESGTGNWVLSGATLAYLNTYWGTYSLELDNSDTATRAQSTAGYENIRLTFALKTSGYDLFPQDHVYVEYTTNYGSTWTALESWSTNFDWSAHEYLLPAACANNAQFGIRFRSSTNSSSDNAWVDEVRIEGTPIPCTLYSLTTQVAGGGSVSVSPGAYYGNGQYCSGTQVTLTATAADGWTFDGWSGSASGTTNPLTVTMSAAKSITANFVDANSDPGLTSGQGDWMKWVSWNFLSATWPTASSAQNSAMYYRANQAQTTFETYQMPYGQAANIWYTNYTRSTIGEYHAIGDSTTWLGQYLMGLCNKYAVTQDSTTLTQINNVLDTLDWLTQCTGKNGYIPRFVGLTNDSAYSSYYQNYTNGYDTCVSPWTNYTWLDYSSRDVYIGAGVGLGAVWINVSDSTTRAKCQTITERILDTLINDSWFIISPNSQSTNPTPGFVTLWQRLAITMNDNKYGSQTDYGTWFGLWDSTGGMDIFDKWYSDYFANILGTSELYVVRKLETNQDKINTLNAALLAAAESDGGNHLNPHMAACYLAGTGDYTRNVPRGVLQGCLIDLPCDDFWMIGIDNTSNPAYPQKDSTSSLYAIMPHDRVRGEYMWQISPCKLAGGADAPIAYMMIDRFVPYWMGRECGAISAP